MAKSVVITGVGLVTPLGRAPARILDSIVRRVSAAKVPDFDTSSFSCPQYAPISDFDAQEFFPDNKTLRLMNRDARMAVVAARIAMDDARITVDTTYPAGEIALYGATGLSGISIDDISRLVKHAARKDGSMDMELFGKVALRKIRPVLSFKILANMPICFVSIFENIRGENAVFTPWEGQGAQAIAAGIDAIGRGDVRCALVGGCDVKTHVLSFISLEQLGIFDSWKKHGTGIVPAEGAAFIVLEDRDAALRRSAAPYATIEAYSIRSICADSDLKTTCAETISGLKIRQDVTLVTSADGDVGIGRAEQYALEQTGINTRAEVHPKSCIGNTFAAAAPMQVAIGAAICSGQTAGHTTLVNCFGPGTEQAAFRMEAVCSE